MHDLLKLKRASDVEAYLGSLPKGLQKAYQRILNDIGDQAGSAPVIAARALRWIMDSAVPLSPKELVAAVCQSSEGLVPHDLDIDTEFVLDACHNLVVIMDSTCRFLHLSVQEYLESHDWPNKPGDQLLGAVCFAPSHGLGRHLSHQCIERVRHLLLVQVFHGLRPRGSRGHECYSPSALEIPRPSD